MAYEVAVKEMPRRHAAVVSFRARAEEMGQRMPEAFGRVIAFLSRSRVRAEGPALAHYEQQDGETFEVEAGFYVPEEFEAGEGVSCIEIGGEEAAVTTHVGPYDDLPAAYEALHAWVGEHGRELEEYMWEEYFSDPQSTPPSEWRTGIVWPLKRKS